MTRFSVCALSRALLVLEGVLLALPSLFGLIMLFGGMISFIYKKDFETILSAIFCTLAFCSFFSFWHIYANVLANKFSNGKLMNKYVRGFALIGGVFSVASLILIKLSVKNTGMEIFGFGILYVPTYFHLLLEINSQKPGTCKFFSKTNAA